MAGKLAFQNNSNTRRLTFVHVAHERMIVHTLFAAHLRRATGVKHVHQHCFANAWSKKSVCEMTKIIRFLQKNRKCAHTNTAVDIDAAWRRRLNVASASNQSSQSLYVRCTAMYSSQLNSPRLLNYHGRPVVLASSVFHHTIVVVIERSLVDFHHVSLRSGRLYKRSRELVLQ